MKDKAYLAQWRSPGAEQRYRDLDAAIWQRELTAAAPEAIDVPTSFGATRAYRWPGDGPSVVFLHGMADTSVRWVPYAQRLNDHDVHAIDIMGDVGASTPTTGFTSAADYADWLHQTIAGLGLTRPTVVGHSLGGYIALSYAISHPVESTVLFDPVGVVKLRFVRFLASGVWALVASVSPDSLRRFLARRFHQPLLLDNEGLRLVIHGQRHHPPKMPPLPLFTDEQLASITSPLQVLVGAESTVFDVRKLVQRIDTAVAGAEIRSLPDAGHAFTLTHFDDCLAAIRSALTPAAPDAG